MTQAPLGLEECPWCRALLPAVDGPTHGYMESTPSCWAAFGRVLAREYSDPRLMAIHNLTVDAYAVQHPGQTSRQAIQSVGVHLIRLCLVFEHGLTQQRASAAMAAAARRKSRFERLAPPENRGSLTVADVEATSTAEDHKRLVREWATQMWEAWSPHHETVRERAAAGLRSRSS